MVYPIALDALPHTVNNSTPANAALFDALIDAANNLQSYVGIATAVQNANGTLTEQINALKAAPGGIFKQTTAPSSPASNTLWIDTSTPTRPLEIFFSSAWHYVGANALQIQGVAVHTATPTNGQVLAYDLANTRWAPTDPTGGTTIPLAVAGDTLYMNATPALAALPIGTPGYVYMVSGASLPVWVAPPFIADPAGAVVGSLVMRNASGVWTHLDPGPTGFAVTSNGSGAIPSYQAIPVTPPGSNITAPSGLRVGSLIQYDGSVFISITPGAANQYLTAHGDTNNPAALLTWTTPAFLLNPMTDIGSMIRADTGGAAVELLRDAASGNWPDNLLGLTSGIPIWRKLGGMKVNTYLAYTEQSSDPAAVTNNGIIYTKTDHHLYFREHGGTIHDLLASGSGYTTIQDEGTPLLARSTVNFVGAGVTAIDSGGVTLVTIPGAVDVILTPHHAVSAASTNATSVSATARKLGLVACYNNNASPRYLKVYDKASAPTVGTDTPILTIEIPGNSTNGAGNNLPIPNVVGLTNGLAYALTTGNADADTGAVAAGDIVVNLGWSA